MSKWLAKAIAFVIALFFVHAQGTALAFASMPLSSSSTHFSTSAQTIVIHPADKDEEEEDEEEEDEEEEDEDSVVIPPIVIKPKPTPRPTPTQSPKPTPSQSPRPTMTPSPSQSSDPTPEPTRDNNPGPSPTGSSGSGSTGTSGNNSGRGSLSGGSSFVLSPLNINIGGSGSNSNNESEEREIFPEENPPMLAPDAAFAGRTPADEFFQAATIGLVALGAAALSLGGIAVQRSISLRRNPDADFIYETSSN